MDMSLQQAVLVNDLALVRRLILAGANVNGKNGFNKTALHYACFDGYSDIVNFLITVDGIDINIQDDVGITPLHFASFHGHLEIVNALISTEGIDVNIKDKHGQTPLDIAADNANLEIVEILKKALEDQTPIKEPDCY